MVVDYPGKVRIESDLQIAARDWGLYGTGNSLFDFFSAEGINSLAHRGAGASPQSGYFRCERILPRGFRGFPTNPIRIQVRRDAAVTLTATLYKNGSPDSTINAVNISPTAVDTWETKILTPGSPYDPYDVILLEINSVVDVGETVYVGNALIDMEVS